MKDLVPHEEKNDAFKRILRYMTDADIVLLASEEQILNRWIYCDVLLRQRKFKEDDIVEKIIEKFSVSKFTARNDIYKAQALFEGARKLSKTYLLQHHAEDIALTIERIKYDKTLIHLLPKFQAEYTRAIMAIPDQAIGNDEPAPQIIIAAVSSQELPAAGAITFDQAKELLQLKKQNQKIEELDYEDLK